MNEKKSEMFAIMFDENRSTILAVIASIADTSMDLEKLLHVQFGIPIDEIESFMKEFQNKIHEKGWCKDPFCEFPEGGLK